MERILAELEFLYGKERAAALAQRIAARLAKYDAPIRERQRTHPPQPLDQRTALLITYGDQVREVDAEHAGVGETPLTTLGGFLDAHVKGIVSAVHLLPFYPYSSDDGFAVMDYTAVDPRFGTWEDIERIGRNFELMFDAVINHVSAQGEWFRRFCAGDPALREFFVVVEGEPDLSHVVRPRALPLVTVFQTAWGEQKVWTTFSADQVDLNYRNPEVLLAVLDVLLFYVARGARFIRLDAIAYLWKEVGTSCIHLPQTHAVIRLIRAMFDRIAPEVQLITETNVPHEENLSYFGDGTNEAQWVYNFALPPLVLHTLQTGDTTKLARWAQTLTTPGERTSFFNFLASHDGIGLNPARGILTQAEIDALVERTLERGGMVSWKHNPDGSVSPYELNINYLDALSELGESEEHSLRRFICAQAMMLALAGVPGIYFHSLFGSRGDRAGAESSGIPRRINRQKLTRAALERELANPDSRRARVFARFRQLLRARQSHPAFHPNAAQRVLADDARVFALVRGGGERGGRVLCVHNITDRAVGYEFDPRKGGIWTELLSRERFQVEEGNLLHLRLEPYGVKWLGYEESPKSPAEALDRRSGVDVE